MASYPGGWGNGHAGGGYYAGQGFHGGGGNHATSMAEVSTKAAGSTGQVADSTANVGNRRMRNCVLGRISSVSYEGVIKFVR